MALESGLQGSMALRDSHSRSFENSVNYDASEDTPMSDGHGQHASSIAADGLAALGQDSKELITTIRKLEALSIDSTLSSLPKIVVVGDQSAGKSSIIEAICDVSLPRSKGTCTRCPFQLTTTRAESGEPSWSCKVSIIRKYVYEPRTQQQQKKKTHTAFPAWFEQQTQVVPFDQVFSKSDLELCLRRAQLAVLNPKKDPNSYIRADPAIQSSLQVEFSPNVIGLEVSGNDLPELSLYDLPGTINAYSGDDDGIGEDAVVDFIRRLIKSYLRDDKALILFAYAAGQDIETTTTISFLRESGAFPRTIGVMTKADQARPEQYQMFLDRLGGHDYFKRMGHGWYMTKQLSQQELDAGLTHEEAIAKEREFFASGEPWTNILAGFNNRFGVDNLRRSLSLRLTDLIRAEVPELVRRVQSRLDDVKAQLSTYPVPAQAPSLAAMSDVDKIKLSIVKQVNADSVESEFRAKYRPMILDVRKSFDECQPKVSLATPGYEKPSIHIDSDETEELVTPTGKMRRSAGTPTRAHRPAKRARRTSNGVVPHIDPPKTGMELRLDELQCSLNNSSSADMPDQVSEYVVRKITLKTMENWMDIIHNLLNNVEAEFTDMLGTAVKTSLAHRPRALLVEETYRILQAWFLDLMNGARARLLHKVSCNTHRPITYATELLKAEKASAKDRIHKERNKHRVQEYFETLEADTGKTIAAAEQQKKMNDLNWMSTTLGIDPYEREIDALATPIAYYQIVKTQLLDEIARDLEYGFLHAFEQQFAYKLHEGLRITDAQHCAELLAEDANREMERARLLTEQQQLHDALAELMALNSA